MFQFCVLPSYVLRRVTFCVSWLYLEVKAQCQYFISSSYMSLDKITWLNPGLKLTIFWGTGPRTESSYPTSNIFHLFLCIIQIFYFLFQCCIYILGLLLWIRSGDQLTGKQISIFISLRAQHSNWEGCYFLTCEMQWNTPHFNHLLTTKVIRLKNKHFCCCCCWLNDKVARVELEIF